MRQKAADKYTILPTTDDFKRVLGKPDNNTARVNNKVCIYTCAHCDINSIARIVAPKRR